MCTNVDRSAIEKASAKSPVAEVAEKYGVNENALVKHLASHVTATPISKKRSVRARAAAAQALEEPAPSTAPAPVLEEEPGPVTSRSPSPAPTARAALDEILLEIRTLMKGVNERRPYKGPDGEQHFEDVPFADKAAAIRAGLQATRLLASLTGELGATESTIASSPYFKRMLKVILEAVSGPKYTEARQAIIDALEREEHAGAREEQAA